ncbi:unnamed protein product [Notodromas monacha]|uniref:G-protein coupled receptors family 1 profile domain-containing protein n=1 Tax=Notodromas monacha TaxID=399045 RepID=A0A7R9GCI3_9CRUS|nr:unnamed protein product [Notodromas monacha]CAG0915872.1 unnamed protein product [Notodromas monacha]
MRDVFRVIRQAANSAAVFESRFGYDPTLRTCTIVAVNGRTSKEALFVVGFLVPCVVIVYCYTRIFWLVRRSEVSLRSNRSLRLQEKPGRKEDEVLQAKPKPNPASKPPEEEQRLGPSTSRMPEENPNNKRDSGAKDDGLRQLPKQRARMRKKSESARESRRLKTNEWRITKMVLAIFLAYVLCYLPITIVKVLDPRVHFPGLHIVGYLLIYMSACLNPIIYGVMNKHYRQAYQNAILCQKQLWLKSITSTNDFNTVGKSSPSANLAEGDERMTLVTTAGASVVLTQHRSSPKRAVGARNGTALPTVTEDAV